MKKSIHVEQESPYWYAVYKDDYKWMLSPNELAELADEIAKYLKKEVQPSKPTEEIHNYHHHYHYSGNYPTFPYTTYWPSTYEPFRWGDSP